MRTRLARWQNKEHEALWGEIPQQKPPPVKVKGEEGKIAAATRLARDGHYSRATAKLCSDEAQRATPAIAEILRGLHPPRSAVPDPRPPLPPHFTLNISHAEVIEAVMSFDAMTSSGAMGLKAGPLQELLEADTAGRLAEDLRNFILLCASGRAIPEVQEMLTGACLTALPKKPTGTRPVAAGELCRRIVGKALIAQVRDRLPDTFLPYQFGVGVPSGVERMVHKVRRVFAAHKDDPDFVLLKVDMKNAFNMVSRRELLRSLEEFPELVNWCYYLYGEPSILWFGDAFANFELVSAEGVQQGDPLGPLLFALVLHKAVTLRLASAIPTLFLNCWFLDDGVIAGTHGDVQRALEILRAAEPYGVVLNPGKCELVWHSDKVRDEAFPPDFAPRNSPSGSKRLTDNFCLLGAPIGDAAHVLKHVETEVLKSVRVVWSRIAAMEDTQVAYTLLRATASANRVNHIIRTVPTKDLHTALDVFDRELQAATVAALKISPEGHRWLQCTLPTSLGGLGLRSARHHAPAAYLASIAFAKREDGGEWDDYAGSAEALVEYNSHLPAENSRTLLTLDTQKALSAALDVATAVHVERGAVDEYDLGRIRAERQAGAGSWLNVIPSLVMNLAVRPPQFTAMVRFWLGMPLYEDCGTCPLCHKECNDARGYHALTCKKGGYIASRHNAAVDIIFQAARTAMLHPVLEKPFLLPGGGSRPADILTKEGDREVANDVAVTHPLQKAYIKHTIEKPGSAQDMYAQSHKVKLYGPACDAAGLKLRPLVADCFGGWSEEAHTFFKDIASRTASRFGWTRSDCLTYLRQRLSMAIMRGNARALLERFNTLPYPLERVPQEVCREEMPEDEVVPEDPADCIEDEVIRTSIRLSVHEVFEDDPDPPPPDDMDGLSPTASCSSSGLLAGLVVAPHVERATSSTQIRCTSVELATASHSEDATHLL